MMDVVVIGAGSGGLVVAIGAAMAGKQVCLIDRGTWGGDCTNYGCIPSKTLIAAAHQGLTGADALRRVRETVSRVRAHEEPAALEEKGVQAIEGAARFVDDHTVEVNGQRVRGKKIVIATGSRPRIPVSVTGTEYLTNETIFDLEEVPERLAVLGGGPIGCELAMAFAQLGTQVRLIQSREQLLPKEEPEASGLIAQRMSALGVEIRFDETTVEHLHPNEQLLVASGRLPNVEGLGLEQTGVRYGKRGIPVDGYARTNRKHILAVGDVTVDARFTHVAEHRARGVLFNLVLPGPLNKRIDFKQVIPRCTFTDPEVASTGMLEEEAVARYGARKVRTYTLPLEKVDRAICEDRTDGFVKVVTKRWSSRILGATIVAPRAGEMLTELTLAMRHKISLRKLAGLIHPYPTYSLAIRQTADLWLREMISRA